MSINAVGTLIMTPRGVATLVALLNTFTYKKKNILTRGIMTHLIHELLSIL